MLVVLNTKLLENTEPKNYTSKPVFHPAERQDQHVNADAWGKYTFQYPYLKLN